MLFRWKNPCFATLTILLAISTATVAQQDQPRTPAAAKNEKEAEQRRELEKKTLALLTEIASAAWSLKLTENRFFVMVSAADLLWSSDEKRARTLYWEALNSLSLISPAIRSTNANLSKAEQEKIAQAYSLVFSLRQRLLRKVAYRDVQLALEMLRATRQVPPRQLGPEVFFPDDSQLEQEIATELSTRDPAHALQVARQSLAKGLSFELLNLLHQLNQLDPEKASQLAADIITKLRTTNVANDFRAYNIALQLLENSRLPNVNHSATMPSGRSRVLSLNDEQKRDLVETLTNAALSPSANSNLLFQITEVMPEIEQFFPERRAPLERKLAAFNETLTKKQRDQNTYNTLIRRGLPEDLIRTATAADDETRTGLYEQAAIIAVVRGKTDSFRDFVSKEVRDAGERRKILEHLDSEEIGLAAARKQLDALRKLLPKIQRKEERARAMAELALLLNEKGENAEAASLLDEAASLIKSDLKDEKQTNALLTLLCAYAVIDPARAFALAERTVDRANSQVSLLLLVDRVVKSGAVRNSEIILERAGIMPLDFLVFKYGKGVAALAKADFNRTRALAERFERNELRLMAQLLLVKGIMQSLPEISGP